MILVVGASAGFGYRNRLVYIGDIKRFDEWYGALKDSDMMYVYLISFPEDEILTGQYYHNSGSLSGYDTKGGMREQTLVLGDTGEVWTIKHMPFSEFKKFVKQDKEIQDELDNKYPKLILGGKYGYCLDSN